MDVYQDDSAENLSPNLEDNLSWGEMVFIVSLEVNCIVTPKTIELIKIQSKNSFRLW
jgi:hypothetical protein